MEITFKKSHLWYGLLLIIILTSLITNLSVTMSTNIVFGDEGFYASRGEWIGQNLEMLNIGEFRSPSLAYKTYFLRPPMFMFFLASLFMIGGELLVKALMPILSVLTALMIFLLVRRMFSVKVGVLSAIFFLAIPSLITYSILLYPEVLGLFFTVSSVLFLYRFLEGKDWKFLIVSGTLGGFAALTEISFLPVFLFYFLILWIYKKNNLGFLKKTFIIGLVIFAVLSPWGVIHNYYQFGNPGYNLNRIFNFPSNEVILKNIPNLNVGQFESGLTGIKESILKMGILNYVQFAYNIGFFLFAILGLSYFAIKEDKKSLFVLFLLIFGFNFLLTNTGESGARNTLGLVMPLAVGAGFFSKKIYDYLGGFGAGGKMIAIFFIVVLIIWGVSAAGTKAENLKPIKVFSSSFFKGCDWIKENTPQDARIVTLWAARAEYNCKRDMFWTFAPGISDAVLAADNRTYEIFKMHGISYVFIQAFSISQQAKGNSYPIKFVQYLETSPDFEKVYSYPDNCLNLRIADCSVVYKMRNQTSG